MNFTFTALPQIACDPYVTFGLINDGSNVAPMIQFWLKILNMTLISHLFSDRQLHLRWPLTMLCDPWPHEHMKVPPLYQKKWSQSDFIFSNEVNFTFITWPQMTFYPGVTFDLINKWGFPCCIYDPPSVAIHQSMSKIAPNVNPFSLTFWPKQAFDPDVTMNFIKD